MREIVDSVRAPEGDFEVAAATLRRSGYSERITEPDRIREAVIALFHHGARGQVRHASGTSSLMTDAYAESVDVLRWRIDGSLGQSPYVIEVVGLNSIYCLHFEQCLVDGDFLITALPKTILRLRRRWLRRAEITSPLAVAFGSASAEAIVGGPVRNISYHGIAFELERPADHLVPGTRIEQLRVFDDAGRSTIVTAEVRCVVPVLRGGCQYGLEVVRAVEPRRYVQIVEDQMHPGTRIAGEWAEALWELYDKCGYFRLSGKQTPVFDRRKSAFIDVIRQLDRAPHLARHVVWPFREQAGVAGAGSVLKIYDRAWLGFQLGKLKGDIEGLPSGRILAGIHLRAYEHIQRDPNVSWIICYAQTKRVWTALVHYDVPARYVDKGEADIVRFRALEFDSTTSFGLPREEGVEIGVAAPAEMTSFAHRLSRMRSRIYCDALDLVPERMTLDGNKRAWNGMRFERDRRILIARKNGLAVAAAVLEVAAEGMHVFGLLDLVRLYPLAAGGEALYPHLLDAAKPWFRGYGKPEFICFLESGTPLAGEIVARANDLGEADMTILAAHRIPELLEHVYEVTTPRTK